MASTAYTRPPVATTAPPPAHPPARPPGEGAPVSAEEALAPFSEPVRAWFAGTFAEPTRAQAEGWAAISAGRHTLIHAPTGSGKTLAAFLWCLDRLVTQPGPPRTREQPGSVRVLYVSP